MYRTTELHVFSCMLCCTFHLYRKANLGHQYYSLFGKEYVKRRYLLGQWRELLNQPEEEQVLEDGKLLLLLCLL